MKNKLGIYIHIPFCIRKCAYCDFLSFSSGKEERVRYVEALKREIARGINAEGGSLCSPCSKGGGSTGRGSKGSKGGENKDEGSESGGNKGRGSMAESGWQVTSIFFGGGTPSVLEGKELAGILKTVRRTFEVDEDAEVTMEANPGTLTSEKLDLCRKAGFNRISLGLQSTHNEELKNLGRIHTWEEFLESFYQARKAGFQNINVDLMSALPGQTRESWADTLHKVCELEPEHISAYSLIIEEGTPFYDRYAEDVRLREEGKACRLLPSEEEERSMYEDTAGILCAAGYRRYEISNYAKPGYECRHNTAYWRRQDYIGFGLGAASLINECRFSNTRQMAEYIAGNEIRKDMEHLDMKARMEEFMFLGLRMCDGISVSGFEKQFQTGFKEVYGNITEKLVKDGLLEKRDDRIALTVRGTDLSNYVMAQYLLD